MTISCVILFFLGGGKLKHLLVGLVAIVVIFFSLVYFEPYRMKRIVVFLDPSYDPQGAGYQLKQSLIAIGTGGIIGKGFGMSAQKFVYLPESTSDSVFAVFAEEFGFVGGVFLISLFLFFYTKDYPYQYERRTTLGDCLGRELWC